MGADLWSHDAADSADPAAALLAIQARLAAKYDLAATLPGRRPSLMETIRYVAAEGDPYDLLDVDREELAAIERALSEPPPADPRRRIELIREVEAYGGEGVGNLLDVREVADHRDVDLAQRLDRDGMLRLVGAIRPTRTQTRAAIDAILGDLGRGECVGFPYFGDPGTETPAGWFFVGNTHH